jgi:ribonuclease VapC
MIVDTSAIIAILRDEPEAEVCARALADATDRRVSAVNYVESSSAIRSDRHSAI